MPSRRVATGLLLVLTLASNRLVTATVPSRDPRGRPVRWAEPTFHLTVPSIVPSGVSAQAMRDAAQRAADSWNAIDCAAVKIAVDAAPSDGAVVKEDGRNMLVVHRVVWCADDVGRSCHPDSHPALTNVRFKDGARRGTSEIHEVDIEINAVHFRWDDPRAPNGADLQTVLTHELGHALGLADACEVPTSASRARPGTKRAPSCVTAPPETRASVMWPLGAPGDVRRRVLSAEDRRAICDMYPKRRADD